MGFESPPLSTQETLLTEEERRRFTDIMADYTRKISALESRKYEMTSEDDRNQVDKEIGVLKGLKEDVAAQLERGMAKK